MRLSEAITLYLHERGVEMRPSTLSKYRATLMRFQLPEQHGGGEPFSACELSEITPTEIRDYRDELIRKGIKPQSVNKYIDRVRAFFQYMQDTGRCPHNPAKGLKPLDEEQPHRVRLSRTVLTAMVDSARHPRDRAMIAAAIEWLLRGGELAAIRLKDLDLDAGVCRVTVEKKKGVWAQDEMVISPGLETELRRWVGYLSHPSNKVDGDSFLFPSLVVRRHGPLSVTEVDPQSQDTHPYRVVGHALRAIGIDVPGSGFHAVRRSMATLRFQALADAGDPDPIGVVKALLHHESRQQTEEYIGTNADRERRNKIMRSTAWGDASPLSTVDKTQVRHLSVVRS